jgi:hypothetical protein
MLRIDMLTFGQGLNVQELGQIYTLIATICALVSVSSSFQVGPRFLKLETHVVAFRTLEKELVSHESHISCADLRLKGT